MRESKCSFCGRDYELGTGRQFAKNDGTLIHFCSSKCRKNYDLGRSAIHTRWTERFRQFREEAKGTKKKKKETLVEKVKKVTDSSQKKKAKKISKRKERKKEARKKK